MQPSLITQRLPQGNMRVLTRKRDLSIMCSVILQSRVVRHQLGPDVQLFDAFSRANLKNIFVCCLPTDPPFYPRSNTCHFVGFVLRRLILVYTFLTSTALFVFTVWLYQFAASRLILSDKTHAPLDGMLPNLQACINQTGSIAYEILGWPWPNFQDDSFMTEFATIDWFLFVQQFSLKIPVMSFSWTGSKKIIPTYQWNLKILGR